MENQKWFDVSKGHVPQQEEQFDQTTDRDCDKIQSAIRETDVHSEARIPP